jgi:integrase/recombinase XerD
LGIGKQAKVLNQKQVEAVLHQIGRLRNGLRNQVIFLLSVRAGLRAKEIAALRWSMVLEASGAVGDAIHLTNEASKGNSGRVIPLNRQLRGVLDDLHRSHGADGAFHVITTERSDRTSAQAVVNQFARWYRDLGLVGCSSHSGRRTFITNAARKISTVGGSLRDVQSLSGHSSLQTTQRYIEGDVEARRRVVDLF